MENDFAVLLGEPNSSKIQINNPTFLNLYGQQRFGINDNSWKIGQKICQRKYSEICDDLDIWSLGKSAEECIRGNVSFYQRQFFLHSFSSKVWNDLVEEVFSLNTAERTDLALDLSVPTLGKNLNQALGNKPYKIKYFKILSEKYKIILPENDEKFCKFPEINLKLIGSSRKVYSKAENFCYQYDNCQHKFKFKLPAGSYATVFLSEYFNF